MHDSLKGDTGTFLNLLMSAFVTSVALVSLRLYMGARSPGSENNPS